MTNIGSRLAAATAMTALAALPARREIGDSWWWVVPVVALIALGLTLAIPRAH